MRFNVYKDCLIKLKKIEKNSLLFLRPANPACKCETAAQQTYENSFVNNILNFTEDFVDAKTKNKNKFYANR